MTVLLQPPEEDWEAQPRRALARNRFIAGSLLVAAALGFVVSHLFDHGRFSIGLLRAVSEAALIGGLADWFAVTAVFRRPLGLPIPHTAILPSNKDRIGRGLGVFIERHFLHEALLADRIRELKVPQRLAEWLSRAANAQQLAGLLTQALQALLAAVGDKEVRAFIQRTLGRQIGTIELAPWVGRAIRAVAASGHASPLIDHVLALARQALHERADRFQVSAERRRWWVPKAVDRQIAKVIATAIEDFLADLANHDSSVRRDAALAIDAFARAIETSPEYRARVKEVQMQVMRAPALQAWLASVADELTQNVGLDLAHPRSRTTQALARVIMSFARGLQEDRDMQSRVDALLIALAGAALPWREELVRFFTDVVRRWDTRSFIARVETVVGADLQYIRITGTLVGASIGAGLFLLSVLADAG